MHYNSRLDQAVLHDCHMYLDSTIDLRQNMSELNHLIHLPNVPLLLLTSTLPIQNESDLLRKLQLSAKDVIVVRGSTSCSNIQYEVHDINTSSILSQVQSILKERRFQNKRILIGIGIKSN
jgi:superfamily II DNA helicase RecQ